MIQPIRNAVLALRLKIVLRGSEPPIWRRVRVPVDATLEKLHKVVQVAMGWTECHLHQFIIRGKCYGEPDSDYAEKTMLDHARYKLGPLVTVGTKFDYEYDFGDGWEHEIEVEAIDAASGSAAECLGGENACPPEDSGGILGYYELLRKATDAHAPDRMEIIQWLGPKFRADAFDLAAVNRQLKKLQGRRK